MVAQSSLKVRKLWPPHKFSKRVPALTEEWWGFVFLARQGRSKRVPFNECVQCGANMIAPTWSEHL